MSHSAMKQLTYTVDLNESTKKVYLDGVFVTDDHEGHQFNLLLYRGSDPVQLPSGVAVHGYFIRYSDNTTLTLEKGTASGNVASIKLDKLCYALPGQFALVIKVMEGEAISAVFHAEGSMVISKTGKVIDAGNVIPSLDDLLAKIADMEAATADGRAAAQEARDAGAQADAARLAIQDDLGQLKDQNAELKDILHVNDTIAIPFEIAGTGFIAESGKITSSSAASHTGYIDISAYERIIFRQAGTTADKSYWFYEFYDADKTRIHNVRLPAKQTNPGYVEGLKEVATNGAVYARFTTIADAATYGAFEIYGVNPIKNAINNTVDDVAVLNATMSMYDSFAVCGASWDCGYYYVGGTNYVKNNLSWGANLARRNGNTFRCFARQSLYTKTWLSSNYGLSALLAAEPCDLYILTFGGNDSAQGDSYLGSIADITGNASYADYPDTFFGNYGKIVEQIKAHAPNALIISIMEYDSSRHSTTRKAYHEAVADIAAHYGHPFMNWAEDRWYESEFIRSNLVSDHPTPVQLSGIACAWERLYSKCVADNYDYFKVYNP